MRAYGFEISNGVDENSLCTITTYLIFANNKKEARKFCEDYVAKHVVEDRYVDDDGNDKNWWWNAYSIDEVDIKSIKNANVRVLDKGGN